MAELLLLLRVSRRRTDGVRGFLYFCALGWACVVSFALGMRSPARACSARLDSLRVGSVLYASCEIARLMWQRTASLVILHDTPISSSPGAPPPLRLYRRVVQPQHPRLAAVVDSSSKQASERCIFRHAATACISPSLATTPPPPPPPRPRTPPPRHPAANPASGLVSRESPATARLHPPGRGRGRTTAPQAHPRCPQPRARIYRYLVRPARAALPPRAARCVRLLSAARCGRASCVAGGR